MIREQYPYTKVLIVTSLIDPKVLELSLIHISVKIARYTLDSWTELRQYSLMDEIRNQLKTMNRSLIFT